MSFAVSTLPWHPERTSTEVLSGCHGEHGEVLKGSFQITFIVECTPVIGNIIHMDIHINA